MAEEQLAHHLSRLRTKDSPSTLVELAISGRNLLDMDFFSKSDPLCVLSIKELGIQTWREVGRTEMIENTLNPDFVKKFIVDYHFEERQFLKFDLYDIDNNSTNLSKQDFLGSLECTLGSIVSCGRVEKPLTYVEGSTDSTGPKKESGKLIVIAEELSSNKEEVTLQFGAKSVDKKDVFGKSDPFLVFSKQADDLSYIVTHKTEVIKVTLNPTWEAFTLPIRTLCNGDQGRNIRVQCFDWNKNGSHSLIGEFTTSMRKLTTGSGAQNVYDLINQEKAKKKGKKYVNSGSVQLLRCKIQAAYSFLDYIIGGAEVSVSIAIDFTSSNGNPHEPTSLHHVAQGGPNLYAKAIQAVGDIVMEYDSDQRVPAHGFGAKVPPHTEALHCFPLNGKPSNPYCKGIGEVLQCYYRSLQSVELYGPTNFAPVINNVASVASEHMDGSEYFILLILTDGVISDMPATKEAIIRASFMPVSIIIVGIGDEDFEAMNILDSDHELLSHKGKTADRDIVQFVPFRDFVDQNSADAKMISPVLLAKEVLAEVPDQFLSFMKKKRLFPKKRSIRNTQV